MPLIRTNPALTTKDELYLHAHYLRDGNYRWVRHVPQAQGESCAVMWADQEGTHLLSYRACAALNNEAARRGYSLAVAYNDSRQSLDEVIEFIETAARRCRT